MDETNIFSTSDQRLKRLRRGGWTILPLVDAMREIDQLRVDLQRTIGSRGSQALGEPIVRQFLADLEEAFMDLAEVTAEKYKAAR